MCERCPIGHCEPEFGHIFRTSRLWSCVCARACLPTAKERNGLYVLLPRDLNGKTIVMTNIGHGESCPGIKPTVATAVLLNAR